MNPGLLIKVFGCLAAVLWLLSAVFWALSASIKICATIWTLLLATSTALVV